MKRLIATLILCAPLAAAAADAPRKPFPDDYTPSKCPTIDCRSYPESELQSAGAAFLGFEMNPVWVREHLPVLRPEFDKLCQKMTSCFATPPNNKLFCLDIVVGEFRSICDEKYPKSTSASDNQACLQLVETYVLGLDQKSQPRFDATRQCALQNDAARPNKTMDVWMVPAHIAMPAKEVPITVYAIDHDTHVPVFAQMKIGDQIVYAPANPAGAIATGYPFTWPVKFSSTTNAQGHTESVPPVVTLTAEGYPSVTFRMPIDLPQIAMSVEPKLESLKPGRTQRVTITVKDAFTGEPVSGRVMMGRLGVGSTNLPFDLEVPKKGKHLELWLSELSNGASDTPVK